MKIDYLNPNYTLILKKRAEKLAKMRSDKRLLAAAKIHYKTHPWDFIADWAMTFEPRNPEISRPAVIPLVPFTKQTEFLHWLYDSWRGQRRGLVEKSRDFGATWLAACFAATMFLFYDGFTAGFGSRKEALVDKKGDPKSIFEKIRFFLRYLPKEFLPDGWDEKENAAFLRLVNPGNGSTITGEAGDDIGRGARMSVYYVDESAKLRNQGSVDAALSQTTNCQIDISTPNGNGNLFFKKRHGGKIPVFVMDWKDDPRKTKEWYEKQLNEQDPVTVAQEIDRDYNASRENIFIPAAWVQASIDAHIRLGFEPEGMLRTSFDPADVGDAKAHLFMHGNVIVEAIEQKRGDIRDAIIFAGQFADDNRAENLVYDASGMGAPAIKLGLEGKIGTRTKLVPFYGGGKVDNPEANDTSGRKNKDRYANLRAQKMMELRERFRKTYAAVQNKKYINPTELMSISSKCKNLHELTSELSRPERQFDGQGRIKVESKIDMQSRGVESPNMCDGAMMLMSKAQLPRQNVYIPQPLKLIGAR